MDIVCLVYFLEIESKCLLWNIDSRPFRKKSGVRKIENMTVYLTGGEDSSHSQNVQLHSTLSQKNQTNLNF